MYYEFFVTPIDNAAYLFDNYFMSLTVKEVIENTPAKKAGVMLNDVVHSVNDISMNDFIDDTYANTLTDPVLHITRNGKNIKIKLLKDQFEDIGLVYEQELYTDEVECLNGCLFCFVDQLPKGMRKSLYVRDDDWRYSVLYGNYITMTNMSDEDFERVVSRKVSPLYISVHATDPEVRFKLMRNKKSRLINEQLKFLYDNKITFHSQIVLCPEINDGDVLKRTIEDMAKYHPYAKTLSVVPVGLTGYREKLPQLTHVDKERAREVIGMVEEYREKFSSSMGEPFVYASDEFYSKADLPYPRYAPGEINAQKANGVGLFSDFLEEFEMALNDLEESEVVPQKVILVTGASAYKEINKSAQRLLEKAPGLHIEVIKVINHHFGESITVSGLLTGCDIIEAVGEKKADVIFVPESSLRSDEDVFLDDMTLYDVEKALGCRVSMSPNDGYEFVRTIIGGEN